jgi:hypothetical protein
MTSTFSRDPFPGTATSSRRCPPSGLFPAHTTSAGNAGAQTQEMHMVRIRRLFRPVLSALLLLGTLSAIGCIDNPCDVQGTVTLNGQPLTTGGTVVLTNTTTGTTYAGTIGTDGKYYITGTMQDYTYAITLFNPQAPQTGQIPARYAYPDNGLPLVYTLYYNNVLTQDIDLQP